MPRTSLVIAAFYNLFQNTLSGANETTSQTILSQPENTDEIVQELDKAAAERLSKSIDEIIVTPVRIRQNSCSPFRKNMKAYPKRHRT